jgi:hypothetical protein
MQEMGVETQNGGPYLLVLYWRANVFFMVVVCVPFKGPSPLNEHLLGRLCTANKQWIWVLNY